MTNKNKNENQSRLELDPGILRFTIKSRWKCRFHSDHSTTVIWVKSISLFTLQMGDHLGSAGTVSNVNPINQTKSILVSK